MAEIEDVVGLIDEKQALKHLMELLAVPGLSGEEGQVAELVKKKLVAAGCKKSWMMIDQANKKIPLDFEIGNLIVKMPGTIKGPRLMFSGHMDTVPLCRGAVPLRKGDRIVPKGKTALGADNRTAVACLITLAETLLKHKLPHPPITLLFTVGEEIGLWGARYVTKKDLGNPKLGFNYDSGDPAIIHIGAIGATRWEAHIGGINAHAGVHPERGVSATLIASKAIADISRKGFFGKIKKGKETGTSNVGIIKGGEATNQVTDYVYVKGEARSHDDDFLHRITGEIERSFKEAAASVKNDKGKTGSLKFKAEHDYSSFCIGKDEAVIERTASALKSLGLKAKLDIIDGGLDANYLNARGIPTVTLGAGEHNPHTFEEYADVPEFLTGCALAVKLATMGA